MTSLELLDQAVQVRTIHQKQDHKIGIHLNTQIQGVFLDQPLLGFNWCQADCAAEQPHQHSHVVLLPSWRRRLVVHKRIPGGDVDPRLGVVDPALSWQSLGCRHGFEKRDPAGTRPGSNLGNRDPRDGLGGRSRESRQPSARDQPRHADHRRGDPVGWQPDGGAHPSDRVDEAREAGLLRTHLSVQPNHLWSGLPALQIPHAHHAGMFQSRRS